MQCICALKRPNAGRAGEKRWPGPMTASIEQIEAWSMPVLSAATLAELFAD